MNAYGMMGIAGTVVLNSQQAAPVRNFITEAYYFLSAMIERPEMYGLFHLISLAAVAVLTVMLCVFFRDAKDKTLRLIVGFFWLAMLVTEVLDQFVIGTSVVDGLLVFEYQWRTFPFQLCNTGLWVMPLIILMPESKFRDAVMVYMGIFSLVGGMITMVYPVTVFVETLMTNIHTMVHHGSQVVIGIYLIVYNRKKLGIKSFARASLIFVALVGVAVLMNEFGYNLLAAYGVDASFNMFYISPHYNSELPVFSLFYDLIPWWAYVMLYIAVFIFIAFIFYFVSMALIYVAEKRGEDNVERVKEVASGDSGSVSFS